MADEIKSAREIALAKTNKLGEATEEERLRWKYIPEGEKLANKCLNKEYDLKAELSRYKEKEKKYIIKGAEPILLASIGLPKSELAKSRNERAMAGLKSIKSDRSSVEAVFGKIKYIFDHYADQGKQQREQAYESLKAEFKNKLDQAIEQQLGVVAGLEVNVESLPQFQEEWRRTLVMLDSEYTNILDGYKQELKAII
jgi:hypothetical protein